MNTSPPEAGAASAALPRARRLAAAAVVAALVIWALPARSTAGHLQGYLPLHTLIEFVSAAIAVMVFWVLWHGRASERGAGLRWLAACLLGTAALDFSHALSYPGMPEYVTPSGPEKAIAFWFGGRLLATAGLLGCAWWPAATLRPAQRVAMLGVVALVVAAVHAIVLFGSEALPATYEPGHGLTAFKVGTEWLFVVLLAVAAWQLHRRAAADGDPGTAWLFAAAVCAALSGWCLTRYGAVTDVMNALGHAFKIAAYLLVYRGVFVTTVSLPWQRLGEIAAAFDTAANPVCITDAAGRVRWANAAFAQTSGHDREALVGADLRALSLPQPGLLGAAVWRGRLVGLRRDGSRYDDERTVTPLKNENGMVTGYVSVGEDVTERLRAERALREDAERLRVLFEAAPDAIVVVDDGGRVVEANPQVERLAGWRPAELLGQPVARLLPRDAAAAVHAGGADVLVGHRDGTPRHARLSAAGVHLGGVPHDVVFLHDQSDRVAAEAALAERELRYRMLMETATDGAWLVGPDGRLLQANDAYARQSGYRRDELEGMHIADLEAVESPAEVAAHLARVRARGHDRFETVHRTKDGRTWPVEISTAHSAAAGGLVFVFVRDLTQQRAQRAALEQNEERLALALRGSNDGLFDRDLRNGRTYLSPGWKAMLGYGEHEIADRARVFIDLVHPQDAPRMLQLVDGHLLRDGSDRLEMEYRLRHRDGHWVPVLARMFVVRDAAGAAVRLVGTHQDLSERERLEHEREQLHRQLLQAQKMDALGQLTGGIAHDFNNMLAAVMGFAHLALERHAGTPGGKLERYLQEIVRVSERGRDLVGRMLAYSRMDTGQPARAVALGPLVAEALQTLRSTLPAGIETTLRADDGLPAVRLAESELHQVLMNLVINARDAIGEHGRIDLALTRRVLDGAACDCCGAPVDGPVVVLAVADTGCGMSAAVRARLFEPFFTTKEVGKGTGLGMPMVQGTVHKAGGHLRVSSTPGRGTTVELLLPAAGVEVEPAPPPSPPPPAAAHGRRVWVVDDDPAVVMYLGDLLESEGYVVQSFHDPQAALAAFELAPEAVDVVVTDQTMPRLSGDALARRMLERRPALPVLLCTGYSDRLDEAAALALGVRAYFRKPFDARRLLATIAHHLSDV